MWLCRCDWLTLQCSVIGAALHKIHACCPEGWGWLVVWHFKACSYRPASGLHMGTPCATGRAVLGETWSCSSHLAWPQAPPVGLMAMRSLAKASEKYTDTGLRTPLREIPQLNRALEKPHRLQYPLWNNLWEKLLLNRLAQVSCSYCCLRKAFDICIILCPSSLHNWHNNSWSTLLLAATVPHFGCWSFLQRTGGIAAKETSMTHNIYLWVMKIFWYDFYIYC